MARHDLEHLVELVRGKGGAWRAGFFAPDLRAIELEDFVGFNAQQRDLVLGEATGEEDVALLVKCFELLGVELDGRAPWSGRGR